MRKNLLLLLLLGMFELSAQDYIDSVQNTFWYSSIHGNMGFSPSADNGVFRINYTVGKSYITYSPRGGGLDSLRYTYHGDSIVLYPKRYGQYYDFVEQYPLYYEEHQLGEKWVFYAEEYLKKLPFDFKRLRITHWKKGNLEIDLNWMAFYNGREIEHNSHYGHYRYQLEGEELEIFNSLIKREIFDLKRLGSTLSLVNSYRNPLCITIKTQTYNYTFRDNTSNLLKEGPRIFTFLDSTLSLDKFEFQNFADGDSVDGVVYYELSSRQVDLFKTKLDFLGHYEERGDNFYLYSGIITSVYTCDTTAEFYMDKKFYLNSETQLDTINPTLLETAEISSLWFERGRAFHKPKGLLFRRLLNHQSIPPNHKLTLNLEPEYFVWHRNFDYQYVPQNAFLKVDKRKKHYTLWGIPYPFLRPDFQVAFEEYVLPDWEAFKSKRPN